MSQDKEREAFEAWFHKKYLRAPQCDLERQPDLGLWQAWQARAALASQQAVKGELVAWIQCSRSPEDGYEQELAWHKDDDLEGGLYEYMPLYASPPSREPLPKCHVVRIGHRFDGERQHHIPELLIEFEPVSVGEPNDAKGWQDRDLLADMLTGIHSSEGGSNG